MIYPLTNYQYTIDNSTAFANEITSLNHKQPFTMATFDVDSLFTNVPLLETTDILTNNINTTHLKNHLVLQPTTLYFRMIILHKPKRTG